MTLRDQFWDDPFFSNSWIDFDKTRDEMMRHSRDMWNKYDGEMKKMEENMMKSSLSSSSSTQKQSAHTSSSSSSSSAAGGNSNAQSSSTAMVPSPTSGDFNPMLFPRRWMMPSLFSEDFAKSVNLYQDKDEQVIRIKDEKDKFEISLDTHGYRPDELKVNIADGSISIEAKHEDKSEDGNKFVSRQFMRKYSMPPGCRGDKVHSNLSSDGILVITAPKPEAVEGPGQRSVPIQMKS